MAVPAKAQDMLLSLRREIARIEGVLPERLESSTAEDVTVLRYGGAVLRDGLLATGAERFDAALGGGLPGAGLIEIHATEARNAGLPSGFALGLGALALRQDRKARPLLWIGTTEIFREAGFPYATGLAQTFGVPPEALLLAETHRLLDALWIAEEAAGLGGLSAVVVELLGNPEKLDLTATRRLQLRAVAAGRAVLLVRHAARVEPTAAPVRLVVAPARSAPRETLAGPLPQSIGRPAFVVSIDKSSTARHGRHVLEWNSHDFAFQDRNPAHPRRLVPLSQDGADLAPAARTVVAFQAAKTRPAADRQQSRKQHAKDRRARRAG